MKTNLNGKLRDRKASLKWVSLQTKVIVLASCLLFAFAGGYFYYAYANPVSPAVYLDDLPSQAYFTIKTDGTNYWAIRYDGYKAYEGTVAHTVINNAITALTSGRTWKEKIALRGSFSLTNYISISSKQNITLDCTEAYITMPSSISYLLYITGASQYIDIIGGMWKGYTNTAGWGIVLGGSVKYVTITGITITNINKAIYLDAGASYITIQNCNFKDPIGQYSEPNGQGIYMHGNFHCEIKDCQLNTRGNSIQADGVGWDNRILGNDFTGPSGTTQLHSAIYLDSAGSETGYRATGYLVANNVFHERNCAVAALFNIKCPSNIIANNLFKDIYGCIIHINSEYGTTTKACDNQIIDNTFINCSYTNHRLIQIGKDAPDQKGSTSRNKISGNNFYNCSHSDLLCVMITGEIAQGGYTDYTEISHNAFYNCGYAIYMYNANARYTEIFENTFRLVTTPITDLGTSTWIHDNKGYKTEASGIATLLKNGDTITHGLVAKPVWATISCLNATYDGEPLKVDLEYTGFTSSVIKVSVYWLNGTAITDDVIAAYWEARTWNYP